MDLLELSIGVENFVVSGDDYVPLTGVFSVEEDINGWRWDRRILPSERLDATRYLTFLGGHSSGLKDGTILEYWQSGSTVGCDYYDLVYEKYLERLQWVPRVKIGEYSVHWDLRTLYSDYSYSQNLSTLSAKNGGYYVELPDEAIPDTATAAIYQRLDNFLILSLMSFNRVSEFSGDRYHEFIASEDGHVQFSDLFSIEVGIADTGAELVTDLWESKGNGLSEGRVLFTRVFPLEEGSVRMASVDSDGFVTLWKEVETLNFSEVDDLHFSVNYDLGTITTGGFQARDLILMQAIDPTSTEVIVYPDVESLRDYSDQGILVIGEEKILYTEKTSNGFRGLLRGYDSTPIGTFAKGTLVEDIQHGAPTTDALYLSYRAVPRLEVEVSDYQLRSANKSLYVDVRPTANIYTNNILQILSANINIAEIVLEIDQPLIGGNLYGPLYYGVDTAKLTARALDARGNPVEDVELSIYIVSGSGSLNGSETVITGITNSAGEIYAYYNSPYSDLETPFEVISVTHDGSDTLMELSSLGAGTSPTDVWVFQVLKHDPFLGTTGRRSTVFESGATSPPNGNSYVTLEGVFGEELHEGLLYILDIYNVKRSFTINFTEVYRDSGTGITYTKLFLEETLLSSYVDGRPAWCLTREDIEWNSVQKRGSRVILYEWNTEVLHPVTGALGAYYPLHPSSISGNTLRFSGRNLAIPAPTDDFSNLGAYVVIAPGEVRFRAQGRDPFSGNLIYSNDIRARLVLPNTLTGVDNTGALPIPYGFRLASEEFNIGTGVGGANFFTVNPRASGINQFNITGVF